jgi:Protein of unknown function DUF262
MNESRLTFFDLFNNKDISIVEIPLIQRDYAQGRTTTVPREIRMQFLDALYKNLTLPPSSPELPLDLDFIYGSLDTDTRVFCPLDGQQRLTTLFLLHWYLAIKDGKGKSFRAFIRKDRHARFTYKVRPSSTEFFDALTDATVDLSSLLPSDSFENTSGVGNELSRTLSDASWFQLSWLQDPTVRSALGMLNAIHFYFKDSHGYYDRLVQTDQPYITFHFLELNRYKLSDELYIKMNARGIPLTAFEAFKARLEQLIGIQLKNETRVLKTRSMSLREYFSHKIDTEWADLFWFYRDTKCNLFDSQLMNFVRSLALVLYPHGRKAADYNEKALEELLDFGKEFTYFKYSQNHCLNAIFLHSFIALLDRLSGKKDGVATYLRNNQNYDENAFFTRILAGRGDLNYSEWIQFYGYCAFLIKYPSEINTQEFSEWMRIVSNLALNTIYNRIPEFKESLLAIKQLLDSAEGKPILEFFSTTERPVTSFNRQQVREERLKAQLICRSKKWRALILKAESHGYFKGQIEFIFKFCGILDRWCTLSRCDWSEDEDLIYRKSFGVYLKKASAIFNDNGLNSFNDFLWQRALLSIGDYLLPIGSFYSFLDNPSRDASWKRLLRSSDQANDGNDAKRDMVKKLLDQVDGTDVEGSLKEVIRKFLEDNSLQGMNTWIRKIVECPATIEFCQKRRIRVIPGDCIYLVSKQRMDSKHAELFTYHLKTCALSDKIARGELKPFTKAEYYTAIEDDDNHRPYACLRWELKKVVLNIRLRYGLYMLKIRHTEKTLPAKLEEALIEHLSFERDPNGGLVLQVPIEQMAATLDQISAFLLAFQWEDTQ